MSLARYFRANGCGEFLGLLEDARGRGDPFLGMLCERAEPVGVEQTVCVPAGEAGYAVARLRVVDSGGADG